MTRSTRARIALKGAGAVLAALVLAACAPTDSTAPVSRLASAHSLGWLEGDFPGYVRVCKASGPAGTYSFAITVVGGGDYTLNPGPVATVNFDGTNQVCAQIYNPILNASWEEGETAQITITELVPEGMVVNQIDVYEISVNFPGFLYSLTGTNSVTVTMDPTWRYKLLFHNGDGPPPPPPPPPGGEGCTPGYWKVKKHIDSWAGTSYSPPQLINTVFTVPAGLAKDGVALGSYTMLQGLSFQGGSTASGKAEILLRAAIAGVLNATSGQSYGMTAADIITAVNAALAAGNGDDIIDLAAQLDFLNNQGCTLN